MTFSKWCEDWLGRNLFEWQENYLDMAYEMAKERRTPFIFYPRRGDAYPTIELMTEILLCIYMNGSISRDKQSS